MLATLVVTGPNLVCLAAQPNEAGDYVILAEGRQRFPGIRRDKAVSTFGLQRMAEEAVMQVQDIAKRPVSKLFVGVPGPYCRIHLTNGGEPHYSEREFRKIGRSDIVSFSGGAEADMPSLSTIVADREYTQEMDAALAKMRLKPAAYISQNFVEGMYIISQNDRDNIAILVNVGYYSTDVCVFRGNAILFQSMFAVGTAHIVSDLVQVIKINENCANQLMRQFAFGIAYDEDALDFVRLDNGRLMQFDHSLVEQIITARMDELASLINTSLSGCGVTFTPGSKLFMLGDGLISMKGAREYLGSKLGIRIENLPLELADGATRFDIAALALLEYVMQNGRIVPSESKKTKKSIKNLFAKR